MALEKNFFLGVSDFLTDVISVVLGSFWLMLPGQEPNR